MLKAFGDAENGEREVKDATFGMLASILTPWRVKWYSRGTLFALAVAFLVILVSSTGTTTITGGRLGGDYPEFYNAGRMIAAGEAKQLYSLSKQREYQTEFLSEPGIVIPFVYPPHFALFYVPLSQLPFRVSYAVHTLAMAAALALACLLIRRIYPNLIEKPELLFLVALTAHPIIRSIMGGQNTALTILLMVLCWYKVLHNKHYQAGLYLGLLFFKPQFAVPLTGLFFLSGRWRVWVSAGATAIALFALSTVLMGPTWFFDWAETLNTVFLHALRANIAFVVSWQAFAQALFGQSSQHFADLLGWGLSAATILAISWVWFVGGRKADFSAQLGLASVCIILIAPQTLFYDAGIALIAFVVLLNRLGRLNPVLITGFWAAGFLQLLSPALGISLTLLPLILFLILATTYLWSSASKSVERQPA